MAIYNSLERPRVALAGCSDNHPLVEALQVAVGSVDLDGLANQPLNDRDALVVWQEAANGRGQRIRLAGNGESHLRVLQFGGSPVSTWSHHSQVPNGPRLSQSLGEELHVPNTCPPALRTLVTKTLIPLLTGRGASRHVLQPSGLSSEEASFTPLLVNSDGGVLAAIYSHPNIEEVWWLPPVKPEDEDFDFASWVTAAMAAWHQADPVRFPGPPDWTRSRAWMTTHELELQGALDEAEHRLVEQQALLVAEVQAKTEALAEAQLRHDREERTLLTGQGDDLVAAVKAMLERLSLVVVDMDQTRAGQRLEDLRIHDPQTSWTALAEVKGYSTSGGKPSDLAKIARFVGIFENQSGSLPDATWYIVNQHASTPPDRRRLLMSNHPEDVEQFVQHQNGVLIDTRDLFLLDRRVAAGEVKPDQARQILITAKRRFHPDGDGTEPHVSDSV